MYRTFVSNMLGLGLGLLLLTPVNAEDTFSTVKGISAEPMTQTEMKSVEGRSNYIQASKPKVPVLPPGMMPWDCFLMGGLTVCPNASVVGGPKPSPGDVVTNATGKVNGNLPLSGVQVHYMK